MKTNIQSTKDYNPECIKTKMCNLEDIKKKLL